MAGRPRSAPSPSNTDSGKVSVPSLNLDPIQSLQPWSVVVTCCNMPIEIPAMPAVDWLAVFMPEDMQLDDVFPGMLTEEQADWVEEQVLADRLDIEEIRTLCLDIIQVASARKWWVTLRLLSIARQSWDALGPEMMMRGVDPTRISLSAWLDILLIIILRNTDPKEVTMFTMRLEAPPVDEETEVEDMEMSRSAFMDLGND